MFEKYPNSGKSMLTLENDGMKLKLESEPRKGWKQAFKQIHESGGDKLLIPDVFKDEDFVYN